MATLAFALFARGPARCHAGVGRGAHSLALRVLYPKGLCVSYALKVKRNAPSKHNRSVEVVLRDFDVVRAARGGLAQKEAGSCQRGATSDGLTLEFLYLAG